MSFTTWMARRFGKRLAKKVVKSARNQNADFIGIDDNMVICLIKGKDVLTTIFTLSLYCEEKLYIEEPSQYGDTFSEYEVQTFENDNEKQCKTSPFWQEELDEIAADSKALCEAVIKGFFLEFHKKCGEPKETIEKLQLWSV